MRWYIKPCALVHQTLCAGTSKLVRRHTKARNSDVWQKKNRKGKRVQWYNKNRYRGYGRLIRRLTAGLSEQQLQQLRQAVEQAAAG